MSCNRKKPNIDQMLRDEIRGERKTLSSEGNRVNEIQKKMGNANESRGKIKFIYFGRLVASSLVNSERVRMLGGFDNTDAFVGSSTGILKTIDFASGKFTNFRPKSLTDDNELSGNTTKEVLNSEEKKNAITAMCYGEDQMEVVVAHANQQLSLFNSITASYTKLFKINEETVIKGLQTFHNGNTDNYKLYANRMLSTNKCYHIRAIAYTKLLTATETGTLSLWNASGERLNSENWMAGENLLCMRIEPGTEPKKCATGGRENPLKIWDLESQKNMFTAKNVRPDHLELRVPIWVTNCRFLNSESDQIVTATGHHQIRLYDPRVQRRPVIDFDWLEEPIQAISTCHRQNHIIVGNNRGELALFDLRSTSTTGEKRTRLIQKYRGFAGAIRCIDAHISKPHFISCGIDRFSIVHDLNTKEIVKKVFCKTQLTCCLLRSENSLTFGKEEKLSSGAENACRKRKIPSERYL